MAEPPFSEDETVSVEEELHLTIVQQPIRSKQSGVGLKDRRHLEPPPIEQQAAAAAERYPHHRKNSLSVSSLTGSCTSDDIPRSGCNCPDESDMNRQRWSPTRHSPSQKPLRDRLQQPSMSLSRLVDTTIPDHEPRRPSDSLHDFAHPRSEQSLSKDHQRQPSQQDPILLSQGSDQSRRPYTPSSGAASAQRRSPARGTASSHSSYPLPSFSSSSASSALRTPTDASLSLPQFSQILLGTLISPCYILRDHNNRKGMFFVFPEMCISRGGLYRLQFDLYDISRPKSRSLQTVLSDQFKVYQQDENYPGSVEPSDMVKQFAKQGIRVAVRPRGDDAG
ncbi:velvet factor [Zopfochytrium polystomum]|nr:velvet factor [Zopfochytrium polystomum]